MELPNYFADFLSDIRPTKSQRDDYKAGHKTLRERLHADPDLARSIVATFLQGSYRRATAVKPEGGKRADVDVIVVTNLDRQKTTPDAALKCFIPFLEKHYPKKFKVQGRSIAIELGYVDLDLVPTSAPSESERSLYKTASVLAEETPEDIDDWRLVPSWLPPEQRTSGKAFKIVEAAAREQEWKLEPLWIPDRDVQKWERTHPLEQIRWTWEKNRACNRHYVNVVKAIKWWRRKNSVPKYPKGYPVEHLIGMQCPTGIASVAAGVVSTFEAIVREYKAYAEMQQTPSLADHGVPEHNVFKRVSGQDFAAFYKLACTAATLARRAYDAKDETESANAWRELFGDEFPKPPESEKSNGGFTKRVAPTTIGGGRFA